MGVDLLPPASRFPLRLTHSFISAAVRAYIMFVRLLLCARKAATFDLELPHPDSCPQIALGRVILVFARLPETNQQEQR